MRESFSEKEQIMLLMKLYDETNNDLFRRILWYSSVTDNYHNVHNDYLRSDKTSEEIEIDFANYLIEILPESTFAKILKGILTHEITFKTGKVNFLNEFIERIEKKTFYSRIIHKFNSRFIFTNFNLNKFIQITEKSSDIKKYISIDVQNYIKHGFYMSQYRWKD